MEKLLLKLKKNKIDIKVENNSTLKVKLPEGFNNVSLIDEIKSKKEELISYINSRKNQHSLHTNIPKAFLTESYQLTPSQRQLFLLHELVPDSLAYNLFQAYKIEGLLDYDLLTKSFWTLINRHESLRTYFEIVNNKPVQKILKEFEFELELIKCNEIDVAIDNFIRPFDLKKAPLIRVGLIELDCESHILLIDINHIVSDGVSQQVLIQDFVAIYNNQHLPSLDLQYKDYADWYYSTQTHEVISAQKDFWINEFDGPLNVLELPTDFPRPAERDYLGSVMRFSLSKEETFALNSIAERLGVSLFMVLLSAYSILLSKLCNTEEIIIGTPVAGRKHSDLERTIGMFVNTLALRLYPSGNLSFKDYLLQVNTKALSCFDNQDFSYEELIDYLKLKRDLGRNPLFDNLFAFQNVAKKSVQIGDLNISIFNHVQGTAKFDLSLNAEEENSCLHWQFEYSTSLFQPSTIERFIGYFKNVLSAIIHDENLIISDIRIISEEQAAKLLDINNNLAVDYPSQVTLVNLFEQQVLKTPNNVALAFKNESITYQELNRRSNILAKVLRNDGVDRNVIVGLLMDKSISTVIAMIAIIKAGGAYLPIDIEYPPERIIYILQDSGIIFLVTYFSQIDVVGEQCKCIIIEQVDYSEADVPNLPSVNRPNDLCYILYTSGTTGNPKGVMVEHMNVVRLLFNNSFQFDFNANDVWTMFHSHCFDFSVWEIYGALLYGGKLVIVPKEDAIDPVKYFKLLQSQNVTVLNQTPTAFHNLINEQFKQDTALLCLRYIIFGGEALVPSKLKQWHEKYPDVKLINMYGITETTVHVTYKEIGDYEIEHNVSNIGKPIPTTSIYLFDTSMHLVPQGVTGEIYIGGMAVTRGYLNKPLLTSERFVNNPYRNEERLYRSGDLGRLLPNGEIEYLGREDHQIQLRGFRIELGEIEYHLMQLEIIDNAIIVLRADQETQQQYLCAYLVSKTKISIEDIRTYLASKLPAYMIPSYFMQIESIPLTTNNKINTKKLPEPEINACVTYISPRDQQEAQIAEIWSKSLNLSEIGIKDNFFSLGGDSLKAIGLIYDINRLLRCSLTLADLYSHQTIEKLKELIDHNQNEENKEFLIGEEEVKAFQKNYKEKHDFLESYEEVYPMNGIEKGMVFHSLKKQLNERNIHNIIYHEQNIYPIHIQNFDLEVFRVSLDSLIVKHDTFRKVYDLDNFAHIIKKQIDPQLTYIDISNFSSSEQELFILKIMQEERIKATDFSLCLLWRMSIIKLNDSFHYLLFDMHHSLLDGWSLSSFITELNNTYISFAKDPGYLPEKLRSNYRDQIISEIAAVKNTSSIIYWQKELKGYHRLQFPHTGQPHQYKSVFFDLGQDLRKDLEGLAGQYNTSLKHLCFAGYIYAMKMITYTNDVTVGIVTNNRPLVLDGEQLLGCFLNTVPFRAQITGNITWKEFIEYVENKMQELKMHEQVPFFEILNMIGESRLKENPVYDTSFNFIDFRVFNDMLSDISHEKEDIDFVFDSYMNNNTLFDFHIQAHNQGLQLVLTYSTLIIDQSSAEKIYNFFKNILYQFVKNTHVTVNNDLLLSETDKSQLLYDLNDTDFDHPEEETVLSLFEKQVAKTPENVAVRYGDSVFNFSQLYGLSNKIAIYLLQAAEVVSGSLVGIMLEREGWLVPCIFGILKAGAAYVPIDPHYPVERINLIIKDAGLKAIITRGQYLTSSMTNAVTIIDLDVAGEKIDQSPEKVPDVRVRDTDLAYVIYTSGSTGAPKGVMVEHRSVVNRLLWMQKEYPITAEDVLLQKTPIVFDVSVWELFWWSFTGASLCLLKPAEEKDPLKLIKAINRDKVTVIHFVPSMLSTFLSVVDGGTYSALASLRLIFASGEALKPGHVNLLGQTLHKHCGSRLINLYGPTEGTVDVTYYECGFKEECLLVPIGKPIDNISLYILDKNDQLLPLGVAGELCIGGVGVARGYINNERLTSDRFISNPYKEGEVIYKTGDLARWLPDGNVEYLDRLDNQVKLRGYRIELGEIESQLCMYEGVKEAVVAIYNKTENDKRLIAFLVPSDKSINLLEVRKFIKSRIPDYMIPSSFVKVDNIPLNANGKVDRKTLLLKLLKEPLEIGKNTGSKTDVEKQLIAIWQEALGIDNVDLDDTFLNLGGHSLLLVKVHQQNKQHFNVDLPFDLYFNSTLRQLANEISKSLSDI